MIKKTNLPKGGLRVNKSYQGEPLEKKIAKAIKQGEPIEEGIPIAFASDPDSVSASHNIKTDKWEIAQDSLSAVSKAKAAKGEGTLKGKEEPGPAAEPDNTGKE